MFRFLITASICILLGTFANAQGQSCFDAFMRDGRKAVSETEYQLGIRHFEAARQCPDISLAQDSIASISIVEANEIWRNRLEAAIATAKTEKANAEKAERIMDTARMKAVESEQKAIALSILADRRADQAEASRLSLLSMEQTDDGSPEEALLLGLVAMGIMEDSASAPVWRAFGNAAFANYATTMHGVKGGVLELHFDPYGWSFAARAAGGALRFYENDKLKFEENRGLIYDLTLPGDVDKNFVSADSDSVAHVWNRNGTEVAKLSAQKSLVTNVTYDPRGASFLTIDRDFNMYRWTSVSDPPILFTGHTGPISAAEFSYGGDMILSRSLDQSVRLWKNDGTLVKELKHDAFITTVTFSPDDKTWLTATTEGIAFIYDRKGGLIGRLSGHTGAVTSAKFTPSDNMILTSSLDGTARLWSLDGRVLHRTNPDNSPILDAELSKNGNRIMLRTQSGLVIVCDAKLNTLWTVSSYQHSNALIAAHLSADGEYVLTSADDKAVRLWNTSGEEVMSPPLFNGVIWGSGFTPDGRKIWACSEDGSAWVCTLPDLMFEGIQEGQYEVPELTDKVKRRYDIKDNE